MKIQNKKIQNCVKTIIIISAHPFEIPRRGVFRSQWRPGELPCSSEINPPAREFSSGRTTSSDCLLFSICFATRLPLLSLWQIRVGNSKQQKGSKARRPAPSLFMIVRPETINTPAAASGQPPDSGAPAFGQDPREAGASRSGELSSGIGLPRLKLNP